MQLTTPVTISKSTFEITHQDKIMLFGSCFSQHIGKLLQANKLNVDINPFGVLYNPFSIKSNIERLMKEEKFTENELIYNGGEWHSFAHHSSFSHEKKEIALQQINEHFTYSKEYLKQCDKLFITWGSAYIYSLKENHKVVANCHKFAENIFDRRRVTVGEIVARWTPLINKMLEQRPHLKIIMTVSPIRHLRDGAHENQLSKSTLLLAIETLVNQFPMTISYFPSYEIMVDELRDYRFYAEDMVHISPLAINYINEQLAATYFSKETQQIIGEWGKIKKALDHRPFNSNTIVYKDFVMQNYLKMIDFSKKYPYIYLTKEIEELEKIINLQRGHDTL